MYTPRLGILVWLEGSQVLTLKEPEQGAQVHKLPEWVVDILGESSAQVKGEATHQK